MDAEHNLIVVFRPYLRENLNPTSNFLCHLRSITIIDEQWDDVLKAKECKSTSDFVDKILDLLKDCQELGWFQSFLDALVQDKETPKNSDTEQFITGYRKLEDMAPYKGLLKVYLSRLVKEIIPGELLQHLTHLSTEDKEFIRQCIVTRGDNYAAMELLTRLPRGGDEWFKELISALKAENFHELAKLLRPPDEENVPRYLDTASEGEVGLQTTSNEDTIDDTNQNGAATQDIDVETNDDVHEKDDDGVEKLTKGESKELKLRNYQIELAKPVVAGENTIIISHTGSGKTVVAVHFINEHFKKGQASNENPEASALPIENKRKKVLFLVNTTTLASQQHDLFRSYLQSSLKLSYLIGDIAPLASLKYVIENHDITFLTAQMVVNALQKNDVAIDDFSMLVFDECHHCHAGNPYNVIMAMYRKRKIENETATLPQIVGLTASIGTGRASSQEKSDEYAKQIFANLDVEAVSIPNEDDEEYRSFVNPPEEVDPILVEPRSDDNDPFKTEIIGIMDAIEKMIEEGVKKQDHVPQTLKDLLKFTDCIKGNSAYEQGVENFRAHCPESVTDRALLRLLRTGGEHLRIYNDALKMNKICRIEDALRLIQVFINEEISTRSDGFNNDDKNLVLLFQEREKELEYVSKRSRFENPLLTNLENILKQEFDSNCLSHAIIFCTKRVTVDAIYSWIAENKRLSFLKPEKIFGSSEMTSDDQQAVLQNFKSDVCNILVGTNVVEEGTDVPACNLVFRYNYMSSDVGRKQAKGRVRQKNSKFYMVASTEFDFEKRDQANKIRDMYMMKSVRTLLKIPTEQLKDELKELQTIDVQERMRIERREREKRESRTTAAYKLLCGKCSSPACLSSDIKVFNGSNHLIVNEEFYRPDIIRVEKHPKPKYIGDDTHKYGKVFCKNCGFDWGVMVTISSTKFAVIKIVSFLLEKCADERRTTCKKWKESPFKVEPLDIMKFKSQNIDWSVSD